jgi:hypothetical protein
MKQLQKFVMLCISFVMTACAARKPHLPEVEVPPERISQKGYSLRARVVD